MITLDSAAADNNNAGESSFVSIPVPVGVEDGDLIVVAVAVGTAGITITPPDASWTKGFRTDPSRGVNIAVYYKTALNEQYRWAFALSAPADAQGVATVYGGVDGWEPVEIIAAAGTLSSASQVTAATKTSVDGEELVLFVCTSAANTFTTPAGYLPVTSRQNVGTLAAFHQQRAAAGVVPAGTVTANASTSGASLLVVLRPSVGTLSSDEVRELIVDKFPTDVERVYDLAPGGDYYKLFQAIALAAKETAFDLVDLLRSELLPQFSRYKLPDWEDIFGLTSTRTALLGTIPDRQAQVLSAFREAAGLGSTPAAITAILGPLLGYFPSTPVQIVTTARGDLDIAHGYTDSTAHAIADGTTLHYTFSPADGGKVTSAGARVILEFEAGAGALSLTLTAADERAATRTYILAGQVIDQFWFPELAGAQQHGTWDLAITNSSGASMTIISTVIAEGVCDGLNDGQTTSAAMFDWGVYADPAHVGENGRSADYTAVRLALQRIAFSVTTANLLQSLTPYPDEDAGVNCSIPDECIPTA